MKMEGRKGERNNESREERERKDGGSEGRRRYR